MTSIPALLRTRAFVLPPVLGALLLATSCSQLLYHPTAVVPTSSPLPYSATVKLADIEAYNVEPGATMVSDPRIENKVTGIAEPISKAKKEWERSITDYLAARKTF